MRRVWLTCIEKVTSDSDSALAIKTKKSFAKLRSLKSNLAPRNYAPGLHLNCTTVENRELNWLTLWKITTFNVSIPLKQIPIYVGRNGKRQGDRPHCHGKKKRFLAARPTIHRWGDRWSHLVKTSCKCSHFLKRKIRKIHWKRNETKLSIDSTEHAVCAARKKLNFGN